MGKSDTACHKEHERTKIFLKPNRDQTEVFLTSNYSGYLTEGWGSLPNQNFMGLIRIISVFSFTH